MNRCRLAKKTIINVGGYHTTINTHDLMINEWVLLLYTKLNLHTMQCTRDNNMKFEKKYINEKIKHAL